MTRDTADVLLKMANNWLRTLERDGEPRPSEDARAALTELALAAPRTALTARKVLRFCGPQVAELVNALVTAMDAREFDAGQPQQALSKLSAKDAAELIGVTPQAIRLAAANGNLTATKHPATGEWRVERAAAEAYRRQRRAA